MPLTTTDVPDPTKKTTPDPEPVKATPPKVEPVKTEAPKPPKKTGLEDAALSSDPLVQKLMWDRGTQLSGKPTEHHNVAPDAHDRRIAAIDDELRKLGFDL